MAVASVSKGSSTTTDLSRNQLISRYLDTNGDGSGTKNANGDYSSAAEEFYIQPGAGEIYQLSRMIVLIEDTSGFSATEYGNLGSALSNGIHIHAEYDSAATTIDLTDDIPIVDNAHWGGLCYDVALKTWGAGNEVLVVRYTFASMGQEIRLTSDDRFLVGVNDNLTGLVDHHFLVQGYIENTEA